MAHDEKLKEKVAEFPTGPGVYLWKDDAGRVLYVGKAKNLRARVRSYLSGRLDDPRKKEMLRRATDVEFLETDSEVDALLLENRLIKDLQPKYNVDLKDSKSFLCIAVEKGVDFPRVYLTRDRNLNATCIGPFTDARGLRRALRILQKVFRFRSCTQEIRADEAKRRFVRPCLLFNLKFCTGPCGLRISREAYRESVAQLKQFLSGKKSRLIKTLREKMEKTASERRFEEAAAYRDRLSALESLAKYSKYGDFGVDESFRIDLAKGLDELMLIFKMSVKPRVIDGLDIATIGGAESVGSIVRFVDGAPFKDGYRRYRIKWVAGVDDCAMMREVATRRFSRIASGEETRPDILLIDGGRGQLGAVREAMNPAAIRDEKEPLLLALAKKEELLYSEFSEEPARLPRRSDALRLLMYVRDEAHRFAQHYHHLLRRKRQRPERAGEK